MILLDVAVVAADVAITSLFYGAYKQCKKMYETVENAKEHKVDSDLVSLIANSPYQCIPYICVSGVARPMCDERALQSQYKQGVLGVLQRLLTKEHKTQRIHGYWTDSLHVIRDSTNLIPFCICDEDVAVQVCDPLNARFIADNLTVTYDIYSPKPGSGLVDRIFGDVSKGYRDTEHMLTVGTGLLGFGRLILDSGYLKLTAPLDENPYILTSASRSEILRSLYSDVMLYKVLTGIFTTVGAAILCIYVHRFMANIREDRKFRDPLEIARRHRETAEPSEDSSCVICLTQPREIVLLNCGHICICADCANSLPRPRKCPICRGKIERIVPTYNP